MENNNNVTKKPWYVRFYIIPDPDKPKSKLLSGAVSVVKWYVFLWIGLWMLGFAFLGILSTTSGSSIGAIFSAIALYGGFWFLKKELSKSKNKE